MYKTKHPERKPGLLPPYFISLVTLSQCHAVHGPHACSAPAQLPLPAASPAPQRDRNGPDFSPHRPGPRASKSSTEARGEERMLTQPMDLNSISRPGSLKPVHPQLQWQEPGAAMWLGDLCAL